MTALVLLSLGALVLMHVLTKHTARPLTMSRTWIATHVRESHDDCE